MGELVEEVVREWLKEECFEIGGEEERGRDLSPLESAGFNLFTTSLAYFQIKKHNGLLLKQGKCGYKNV